jgi:hypothetical protein
MSEFKSKETIEDFAKRMSIGIKEENYTDGLIDGAKWQKEQIDCELSELLERYNKAVELLEKLINDVTFLEEAKQFLKTL